MGTAIMKPVGADLYLPSEDPAELQQILEENMGPEGLDPGALDRAINPQGKSGRWEIPTVDDSDFVSEVEGVVLFHRLTRSLWEGEFGESSISRCRSFNGLVGVGDPGGDCTTCPLARFDGDEKPPCRQAKEIFLLREGELLPTIFRITPGGKAIPNANRYFMRLFSKARLRYHHCVTKMELVPDKSAGGIDFFRPKLSLVGPLSPEDRERIDAFRDTILPHLERASVGIEEDETATSIEEAARSEGTFEVVTESSVDEEPPY